MLYISDTECRPVTHCQMKKQTQSHVTTLPVKLFKLYDLVWPGLTLCLVLWLFSDVGSAAIYKTFWSCPLFVLVFLFIRLFDRCHSKRRLLTSFPSVSVWVRREGSLSIYKCAQTQECVSLPVYDVNRGCAFERTYVLQPAGWADRCSCQ